MKDDYKVRIFKMFILEAVIKSLNNCDYIACIEFYERFKSTKELIGTNYTKTIMKQAFVILTLKIIGIAN